MRIFFRMVGSEMKMGKTKHIYRHQEWHIIIRYFNDSHINGRQCKEYEYICDNVNINVHLAVICKLKRFGVRWNKMKCNAIICIWLIWRNMRYDLLQHGKPSGILTRHLRPGRHNVSVRSRVGSRPPTQLLATPSWSSQRDWERNIILLM